MNSLYGNYRTKKFVDFYPDADTFFDEVTDSPLYDSELTSENIVKLYYLLYARYGNSNIASSDPNQFKYKMFSIIANYGPIWQKNLEIQKKLRALSDDQIRESTRYINSHAYNPGEGGIVQNDSGDKVLDYINDQNTSKATSPLVGAYDSYLSSLSNYTDTFIGMFKNLFLTVVQPEKPLWYRMDEEEN